MARRLLSGQGVIEVVAKSRGEGQRLLSPSGEHPEASGTLGTPVFKRQRRGVHPGERTGAEELGGEPRIFCPRKLWMNEMGSGLGGTEGGALPTACRAQF